MWDCSVCTYRNSPEAFKCLMCDVRKGTSTRKPRLNAELVAAQAAQVAPQPKPRRERRRPFPLKRPRLKNVDRSTAQHAAVTVNNITVIITEFQPKQRLHALHTNHSAAQPMGESDGGSDASESANHSTAASAASTVASPTATPASASASAASADPVNGAATEPPTAMEAE